MNMNEIKVAYQADLDLVKDAKELAAFWTKYLSKTGSIQGLMAGIKSVPKEEKKAYGQAVNEIKTWAQDLYDAKKEEVDIIALSALMTTTMTVMKEVVFKARERNLRAKVIIGGAVVTNEYALEIGADGYSSDAADCVRLVNELFPD